MSWPGYFISFEGLDGAGKTTQVAALAAALRADGHNAMIVRPSDTGIGDLVRGFLLQFQVEEPVEPWAEALFFIACRVQLLQETIVPALQAGAVVIADRYADSTLAYQGGGRGLDLELLRTLHREACGDVLPDLTLLLELPRQEAIRRQRVQELPIDRIESEVERFHHAVEATFNSLAEESPERFVRIDAQPAALAVSQQITEVVRRRIAARDNPVDAVAAT